jgi:hypothetical protein
MGEGITPVAALGLSLAPRLPNLAFGASAALGLISFPIFWMFGATQYFVLVLAVWLAVFVYWRPKEAASAGVLFIIACNVLFPSRSRFDADNLTEPWEMYYWAAGLLIITLAAILRTGAWKLLRIPTSLKAFALVVAIAGGVGLAHGGSLSYVSRQLYGSVLLVTYFAIGYHTGDEGLFLRRLRTFGLLSAVVFFAYYAVIFGEYGFHKEITTIGTLESVVAILCFVVGIEERKRAWIVSGLIVICVPVLLFIRHAILSFAFGVLVALAMVASAKKLRLLFLFAAVLVLIPSIFPEGAEIVLEKAMNIGAVEAILPVGTRDVSSLMDRNLELVASLEVLQKSPLFGEGFGSELSWDSPVRGRMVQAYVDNGWAYVGAKMGFVGLVSFTWFIVAVLRHVSRKALAVSISLLAIVLVVQFSEPAPFQFTTSPLCGALCGLLLARQRSSSTASATSEKIELVHV